MEKDVLVAFEDRVEIVKGVSWNTTAEKFIKRYNNTVATLNLAADLENHTTMTFHRPGV